jgi:hypothetical protein
MSQGRGTQLQGRAYRFGEGRLPNQVVQFVHTLVEGARGNVRADVGDLSKALADVDEVFLGVLEDLEEGVHILGSHL